MSDLYSTDIAKLKLEIESVENIKNEEFFCIKKEVLQAFYICYSLYLECESEQIFKKLVKLTELLKKCKLIEKCMKEENSNGDKKIESEKIANLEKKRRKKTENSNPRKKYKNKGKKLQEARNNKYNDKIL